MARKKRGRPPFKPTAALRLTVERMRACGDTHDTIARALGIDDDTLRKHFPGELLNGSARQRRKVVEAVFRGVDNDNATLIKRAEEMTRASAGSADLDGETRPEKPPRQRKLGKKEVQHQEALAAGADSEWGEDLQPPPGTPVN